MNGCSAILQLLYYGIAAMTVVVSSVQCRDTTIRITQGIASSYINNARSSPVLTGTKRLRKIPLFLLENNSMDYGRIMELGENIFCVDENGGDEDVTLVHSDLLAIQQEHSPVIQSLMKIRGGEEEDDSDSDEEEDKEKQIDDLSTSLDYAAMMEKVVDVTKTKIVPVVVTYSKKGAAVAKRVTISVYHALHRAVRAGYHEVVEADDDDGGKEDDKEITVADKILNIAKKSMKTIHSMVTAAMTVPEEENEQDDDDDVDDDGDTENGGKGDDGDTENGKRGEDDGDAENVENEEDDGDTEQIEKEEDLAAETSKTEKEQDLSVDSTVSTNSNTDAEMSNSDGDNASAKKKTTKRKFW